MEKKMEELLDVEMRSNKSMNSDNSIKKKKKKNKKNKNKNRSESEMSNGSVDEKMSSSGPSSIIDVDQWVD